jgi:two-component system, OmpR family, sensor histidine kinase CpxA
MKFNNLYIKLFVSLLFASIVFQVYYFIDSNSSEMKKLSPERDENRIIKLQMLKQLIEEKIHSHNGFSSAGYEIKEIVLKTSELYKAKIWIENSRGIPVIESFSYKDISKDILKGFDSTYKYGDVNLSHIFQGDLHFIFTDVALSEGLNLKILYRSEKRTYRSKFLMGLAGIILVMTILALSLLQFIRIKVNRFRNSVLIISNGDLSHRVSVQGKGVVEDLGRAFNGMTDKLEKMIATSKEITANVSHEIRTPLTRIRVVEDLLRKKLERADFSDFGRHLDSIREDIQILDDLTGRLLEFVKLDRYELISKDEQLDPSELMNSLVIRFEPVIESKDLKIKNELSFAGQIQGDRKALTSAFLNILDNAFKYTPEHGEISIRTGSEQDFFKVSITNSFEKIDEKDLQNIFKPFERARQSDSAGSGLGLAITKKIVEKHGGNIIALNSNDGFEIQIGIPL